MPLKTRRRFNYTPAAVQQALDIMASLAAKTPRERAEERMRRAKARLSAASNAVLSGMAGAAQQADAALEEVNRARAELAALAVAKDGTCQP